MVESFHYHPIQEGEIRLLRVIPCEQCNSQRAVITELGTFSRTASDYTALSYRWGSPDRTQTIEINGQHLLVTESLESFLRDVRSRQQNAPAQPNLTENVSLLWQSGWLWIDAICINQDDVAEKGQQVQQMREIYEAARSIVIWLNVTIDQDGIDDAFYALGLIADLGIDDEEQGHDLKMVDGDMPGISCKIVSGQDSVETLYTTLFDIGEILNNDYWNRMWIIQEASTPKDREQIWVCCPGEKSMSWDTFVAANQRLVLASWHNEAEENANLHGIANSDIATAKYIQDRRRSRNYEEPLYTMLVRCRVAVATDPRDKVYAVLGLARERNIPELRPNYAQSIAAVYETAAKAITTNTDSLDCLGSAGLLSLTLPTWVPDWTVLHDIVPQPFYQYERLWEQDGSVKEQKNLFRASGVIASNISFSESGKQLIARGFQFDIVTTLSVSRDWRGQVSPDEIWSNWRSVTGLETSERYVSDCPLHEAIGKVICTDINEVWGDWSAERGRVVDGILDDNVNPFEQGDPILDAMTWNRKLLTTKKRYVGLGPSTMQIGDAICILFGSQMPVILRKEDQHWLCVGQAYIEGLMDGEAIELSDNTEWGEFVIE